ncbi:response regulator [Oceanispirochaeta sp.]|jgi:two-component system response regulator YesN|uniref:response regulator n=1 Tax=Oceanispirochaeta sp. TaxID=2035350 RepID=UPI002604131E|nr:response regulator [Oceanispirochaeta sp.]MDA3957753.1 response regulator [Oceanispirochaeta sp.]
MFRVLIVDDEPLAREHIRETVDWQKLGIEVCGEASDGTEALIKIKELQPQIILLDLIMPLMDGMSLAEHISENNLDVSMIISTGSDEFEFVRKSMKHDVKDYLLKPFDINELELALLRIKNQLTLENQNRTRNRNAILYNMLTNPIQENFSLARSYYDFDNKIFEIAVIYNKSEDKSQEAINSLTGFCRNPDKIIFIKSGIKRIICFSMTEEMTTGNELATILQNYLIEKQSPWSETLIGISRCNRDILTIGKSLQEATETVNNGIIFGEKGIKKYKIAQSDKTRYFYSSKDLENLLVSLRKGNSRKVKEQIDLIFQQLVKENVEYDNLLKISNGLISLCYSMMIEKNNDLQNLLDQGDMKIIFNNRNIDQIKHDVISFYQSALQNVLTGKVTKSQKVARGCVKIIEQKYADSELSITMIAEELNYEVSYLRRVFRKEIGDTINGYIIGYRMQKAKEILHKKRYRHSEIASMIGYEDASYFSKSFKKYVGISPKEFEISN